MASLQSHRYIEIILNGHRFTTFADDDPPYQIISDDMATFKLGGDGKQFGLTMPTFGGELVIRLTPDSPSTQWAVQRKADWLQRLRNRVRLESFKWHCERCGIQ